MANESAPQSDDSKSPDASANSTDQEPPNEAFQPRRAVEILRGLWRESPRVAKEAPVSDRVAKAIVTGLTQREIALGSLGAIVLIALSVFTYVNDRHSSVLAKREVAPDVVILGVLLGLVMLAGIFFKRRSVLGFAAMMAGLQVTSWIGIIGVLYLGLGGWIIMRWTNLQRQKQDAKRAVTNAVKSKAAKTTRPTPPGASKRYTPPRRRPTPKSSSKRS